MLPLPSRYSEPVFLADWLELSALCAGDSNSSRGDLDGALRRAGIFDPDNEADDIEKLVLAAFLELEQRASSAQDGYTFSISGSTLEASDLWKSYPAYVFCLCLSYFGAREGRGIFPRRWFEHLSRDAARHYLGGEGVRFGSPRLRTEIPTAFARAVDDLCSKLNEGGGYVRNGLANRRDDAVDIVVWKHFPDKLPGKVIMFGNCASERDWEGSKRMELNPKAFCEDWFKDSVSSEVIKSFFIPHRFDSGQVAPHVRRAGIVFDRCRIAYWARCCGSVEQQHRQGNVPFAYKPLADWAESEILRSSR